MTPTIRWQTAEVQIRFMTFFLNPT